MSSSEAETSYREFVQRYVKAGQLSPDETDALEAYRSHLRLLPDQAKRIEQEVLAARKSAPDPVVPSTELGPAGPSAMETEARTPAGQGSVVIPQRLIEPFEMLPPPVATTVFPPKNPENYFAHLQQYGQEFSQALRAEGMLLSDETKARLSKRAKEFELSASDVAEIERKMLVDLYSPSKPPEPVKLPDPAPPPDGVKPPVEKYSIQLQPLFEELEANLQPGKLRDLRAADVATFKILQAVIEPSQSWLDEEVLKKFVPKSRDKKAIQEIDRLWSHYSEGRFGFSRQLQLYGFEDVAIHTADLDKHQSDNRRQALDFSKLAKWWIDGLEFFKSYNQLDFTVEAPAGHLPARWFWEIPRSKAFNYGNLGLLDERGWCRIDAFILPAFMYTLKNCGITPLTRETPDTQISTSESGYS
jgi:GUN4-like